MNLTKLTKALPHKPAVYIMRKISATQGKRSDVTSLAQDAIITKKDCMSQGLPTDPENRHPQDVQSQLVRSGLAARAMDNFGIDAASPNVRPNPGYKSMGNPEGIGMLEQVGSASATLEFYMAGGIQGEGLPRK